MNFTVLMTDIAPAMGAVGVFTSSILGFGPLPAVLNCRKTKHLGEMNVDPFPILFGNALGWIIYSCVTTPPGVLIFAANVSNVLLGMFFLLTGYNLTPSDSVRLKLEILSLFFLSLWMGLGFLCAMIDDNDLRVNILGVACNILVLILFASPLSTMAKVVTTKSSASINRPFAVVQVINCALWVVYGVFAVKDKYVWIPNVIGFTLGVMQISLILLFPKGRPTPEDVEEHLLTESRDE